MRSETTPRDTAEGAEFFKREADTKEILLLGVIAAGIVVFMLAMEQQAKGGK